MKLTSPCELWKRFSPWFTSTVPLHNTTIAPTVHGVADLDDAISAAGCGRFNVFLLAFCLVACVAFVSSTSVMSYVIPSAECDLNMSLLDKGLLNAISHMGMICSAPFAGFLGDTLGRKKVMVWGLLLETACNIVSAFTHHFWILLALKFTAGALLCGPSAVLLPWLAEFHRPALRPSVAMFCGLCYAAGNLGVPLLAWALLSRPWDLLLPAGLVLHAWQRYIAACSVPALLAALLALRLPESPRFLAASGQREHAVRVLRAIYAANTGRPPHAYPISELKSVASEDEKQAGAEEQSEKSSAAPRGGLRQLRPHLGNLLLVISLQFGSLMGCNTLRLWLPQLFKMMSDHAEQGEALCTMISLGNTTLGQQPADGAPCSPIPINPQTYINSVAVAGIQLSFAVAASIVIGIVGKKPLLMGCMLSGGGAALGMYWSRGAEQARLLAAVAVALSAVSSNAVNSVAVDLFPTALRSTAMSLTQMSGRVGSISGSLAFPALLAAGCLPPFLTLGVILTGCALMAAFIPNAPKEET